MSLVRILALAVALFGASTAIGALLTAPLALISGSMSPSLRRVARPLGGLVLLPLMVWWWVEWVHRPVHELAWPIRAVVVAGLVVMARERRGRRPGWGRVRVVVRRHVGAIVVLGFFFVLLHPLAHQPAMTASSDAVADAPFYSIVATSLIDDLPLTRRIAGESPGEGRRGETGYDAHRVYRIDHHGAYGLLAATSAATGLRTVSVQWSVLIAATLAMVQGLTTVTRLVFRSSWVGEVAVTGAALGSLLSVYMRGLFPLGQVLGLSFLPALAVALVFAARARSRPALLAAAVATWLAFDGVFRSYLFILPAFVPWLSLVFAATVGVRSRRRRWRAPAVVRPVAVLAAAAVVTVALAPDGALEQFRRFTRATDAPNGWSIDGFRPSMTFGFMRGFEVFAGWGRIAVELVVLVTLCMVMVALVRADRRRRFAFALAAVVATSVAYALYYRSKGPSYQQWKLAVSFSFVAWPLGWAAAVEAVRDGARRVARVPFAARWALPIAAVVVAVPLAVVARNGRRQQPEATAVVAHPEALALARRTPISCAPVVQVASDDQVNENWLVYAFLDREVRPVRTSYFGALDQQELPTVWLATTSVPAGVTPGGTRAVEQQGTLGYDARVAACATGP